MPADGRGVPAAVFSCPEKSRWGKEADGAGRKDFAKKLKENYCFTDRWGKIITKSTVDNLVKEMTEVPE